MIKNFTILIDRIVNYNTVSDVNENYGIENDYATLEVEIMHKIFSNAKHSKRLVEMGFGLNVS